MADQGTDYTAIGTGIAGFFATIGAWWAAKKTTAKPPPVDRRENDRRTREDIAEIKALIAQGTLHTGERFDRLETIFRGEIAECHRRIDINATRSERAVTLAEMLERRK